MSGLTSVATSMAAKVKESVNLVDLHTDMIFAALAGMGGVAKYLHQYVNGQAFQISIFVSNIFISGFSGLMFSHLGSAVGLSQELLYVCAGVGGAAGWQVIEHMMLILKDKLK